MCSLGSNRTFMELKFVDMAGKSDGLIGSNRTFMELKFRQFNSATLDYVF